MKKEENLSSQKGGQGSYKKISNQFPITPILKQCSVVLEHQKFGSQVSNEPILKKCSNFLERKKVSDQLSNVSILKQCSAILEHKKFSNQVSNAPILKQCSNIEYKKTNDQCPTLPVLKQCSVVLERFDLNLAKSWSSTIESASSTSSDVLDVTLLVKKAQTEDEDPLAGSAKKISYQVSNSPILKQCSVVLEQIDLNLVKSWPSATESTASTNGDALDLVLIIKKENSGEEDLLADPLDIQQPSSPPPFCKDSDVFSEEGISIKMEDMSDVLTHFEMKGSECFGLPTESAITLNLVPKMEICEVGSACPTSPRSDQCFRPIELDVGSENGSEIHPYTASVTLFTMSSPIVSNALEDCTDSDIRSPTLCCPMQFNPISTVQEFSPPPSCMIQLAGVDSLARKQSDVMDSDICVDENTPSYENLMKISPLTSFLSNKCSPSTSENDFREPHAFTEPSTTMNIKNTSSNTTNSLTYSENEGNQSLKLPAVSEVILTLANNLEDYDAVSANRASSRLDQCFRRTEFDADSENGAETHSHTVAVCADSSMSSMVSGISTYDTQATSNEEDFSVASKSISTMLECVPTRFDRIEFAFNETIVTIKNQVVADSDCCLEKSHVSDARLSQISTSLSTELPLDKKNFTCKLCAAQFKTEDDLQVHLFIYFLHLFSRTHENL